MAEEKKLQMKEFDDAELENVSGGMSNSTAYKIIEIDEQIMASSSRRPTPEQERELQRLALRARNEQGSGIVRPVVAKALEILRKYGF